MKYLDKHDVITYENGKEYLVINSVIIENENFVYLIEKDNMENQFFARVSEENNKLRIDEVDSNDPDNKEIMKELISELGFNLYKELRGVTDEGKV